MLKYISLQSKSINDKKKIKFKLINLKIFKESTLDLFGPYLGHERSQDKIKNTVGHESVVQCRHSCSENYPV
jgi:hypothetical protein